MFNGGPGEAAGPICLSRSGWIAGAVGGLIDLRLSGWAPTAGDGPAEVGEFTPLLFPSYCPRRGREEEGPVGGWRSGVGGRMGSGLAKRSPGGAGCALLGAIRAVFLPLPLGPEGGPGGISPTVGMLLSLP